METRICKHCNKELPITDFYLSESGTNWRKWSCRFCESKASGKWNKLNKEQKNFNNRKYYQTNPDARITRANRAKEWRDNNYEKYRENINTWNKNHLDLYLNYSKMRRARIMNAPINDFTSAQWEDIKERYGYRCVYCGKKVKKLTRDHVIPLVEGGSNTASNIVPACQVCNSRKHDNPAPIFQMAIT